jgi:2'-5' RNA ligase
MRCFVAIDLPDDVRRALDATMGRLRGAAPRADVRWVSAQAMHLTLKFLGQVPEDRLPEVREAVEAVATATPRIRLACAGLGFFPGPSRPRVVWAGITEGVGALKVLAAVLEAALEPLGFPPEGRPFRGHVTLGRVRSPRAGSSLARAMSDTGDTSFGAWTASQVVLYRSHLRPTGSIYEPLARLSFDGRVA